MDIGTALSGPLACCSSYNYTKWALWQTVGAKVGVGHCSMWREELTEVGAAKLSCERLAGKYIKCKADEYASGLDLRVFIADNNDNICNFIG